MNSENRSLASFEKDLGYIAGELDRVVQRQRDNGWEDLKPDQRAFAIAYIQSYSHIQAARDIGKNGKGLAYLNNPLVRALIADLQADQQNMNIITENFVRQKWLELLPKMMGEEKVNLVDAKGNDFTAQKFHSSESVSVLKELSKSTKFYEDGSGGDGVVNVNIDMGALTGEVNVSDDGKTINVTPDPTDI